MQPTKTYDSRLVAKYLLAIASSKNIGINTTQMQKLLYILYGLCLANCNGFRILDESPQAWPFGPVFPKTRKIDYNNFLPLNSDELKSISDDLYITSLITKTLEKFGKVPANKLSEWSHTTGSPWDKTTKISGFSWSMQIPDIFIVEYFQNFAV